MKRSPFTLSDIISSFEKKDEIYKVSLTSSEYSSINTDSELSSISNPSSRQSSRPTTPTLVPHFNVLNIEEGASRQLPCKTWISTGTCPYNRRCQFNHDPRAISIYPFSIKTRKKSAEDTTTDSLFWPPLPRYLLSNYHNNEPAASQYYLIPHPQNAPFLVKVGNVSCLIDKLQAEALFSMYNYFLDFLNNDALYVCEKLYSLPASYKQYNEDYYNNDYADSNFNCNEYPTDYTYSQDFSHTYDEYNNNNEGYEYNETIENHHFNEHTGKRRLSVFINLSEGKSI